MIHPLLKSTWGSLSWVRNIGEMTENAIYTCTTFTSLKKPPRLLNNYMFNTANLVTSKAAVSEP
jgi:hypothetical protein